MRLRITGLSHKTAPLELRERLAFEAERTPEALRELTRLAPVSEAVILSTCNRVELITAGEPGGDGGAVVAFLCKFHGVARDVVEPHLYQFEGDEAISHLFRVASSLDSMVVGEPQILGQLKAAFAAAKECGAAGGCLEGVFTRAFNVAKRVRSETGIGRSPVSAGFVAVELARQIFGSLAGCCVLLVGAGKISELAARRLAASGARQIYVTNRTAGRAEELAGMLRGTAVPYEAFAARLSEMDIVIASTAAPQFVLRKEEVRRAIEARRKRPVFLIDISVPRSIDPAVDELEHAFLYDIDDLQGVADANRQARLEEASQAERIVAAEVGRMISRLKVREVTPAIVRLQEWLEQVRAEELERARGKLADLSPAERETVEAVTRGIIARIAHAPISQLKRQACLPEGAQIVELIRRLFRLEEE